LSNFNALLQVATACALEVMTIASMNYIISLSVRFKHTIRSVDDAHCIDASYLNAKHKLEDANIWNENKALIENISIAFRRKGASKTTITWYLYYTTR
jgi:hypothetical protein